MKRKLLFAIVALLCSVGANAQASFNHTYTDGVTVNAGSDYFLYNIGSGMFLTDGMDWGTHATTDHAGRVITFAEVSSGKYSIYTASVSVNNGAQAKSGYMTTNGYLDTGTNDANWEFTSVSVDGYTNAYTIKNSDTQYLYVDASDARVQVGESTGNNYSYWLIIPKSARETAKDYTFYLQNTDFNRPWERVIWTVEAGFTNQAGGLATNRCAEFYHKTFDMYQTINASVADGRYKLYAQAFYRKDGGSDAAYLYANDDSEALLVFNAHGEETVDNMNGASTSFNEGKYVNSVETFVDNGSLKVGIKNDNGSNWVLFDNFYLEYLGQCVMDYAEALPDGGAMEADTWYYFDIAVAGDNYNATATTLGDIVCTNNGYALTSNTGNVTLTATDNNLAVGRYYVKSSSANNLVVAPASYTYNLGDITNQSIAEGSYIQSLTTFVLTYGDAATSDGSKSLTVIGSPAPVATLKKNGSTIATGTLAASNSAKTLTATFSDVTLVLNSTDYSIEIPAGCFGYADEDENAAFTVNFNTPLFADGDYYLKNKNNGAYFAGGNGWGTQAITNAIGHKVTLTALSDGKYYINTYLNNGGESQYLNGLWCDGAATGWTFTKSGDDYVINDNTGKLTAGSIGAAMSLTDGTGDNTKWTLLTVAAWKTEQVARLDDADIKTGVDATFYLPAAKFNRNDLENNSWQGSPGIDGLGAGDATCNYNGQKWNTNPFDVYQELTGLKSGVYKLTMQGFYRNGTTDDQHAILYANGYEVPLVNIRSAGVTSQDDDKGFTTANGDYYVPNKQDQAAKAFNNDYYQNELYFAVGTGGTLRIGVKKNSAHSGDWTVFDNFQLTYYGPGVTGTIASSGYSTFSTDQALDFTKATGITAAYVVSNITNTYVSLTKVDELPANSGMILKGTGGNTFIIPSVVSAADPATNYLQAAVTATAIGANEAYILKSGEFCLVTEGSTVPAGKAYLLAEDVPAEAKALSFTFDDEATAIRSIEGSQVTVDSKDIYNVAGQRMSRVQKGVNIVNGKKILVK